jgi:hypothetical protein
MSGKSKSDGRIADIATCRSGLLEILEEMQPMTVRQLFYQGVVRGLFYKSELGYNRVWADSKTMRLSGEVPYDWLEDNTRSVSRPRTYTSPSAALESTARRYRKSFWADADCQVQIWLEKDALSSIVYQATQEYDVPLYVARGFSSLSFLYSAAEDITDNDVPAHIYHLGDFDPSGVSAGEAILRTLNDMAPDADIEFERIAVTKQQIRQWRLPSRPTKKSDSRAARFDSDISVELDAIAPDRLRGLVRASIERHMPPTRFKKLKAAERREQRAITKLVEDMEQS